MSPKLTQKNLDTPYRLNKAKKSNTLDRPG